MSLSPTLVWFRQDLRLADQPALAAALRRGGPIVPVFIWAPAEEGAWIPGGATRWWLHASLYALGEDLETLGARLILRAGPSLDALRTLARETGAKAVYWNRRYEPSAIARDTTVKAALREDGLEVESFNGALLVEPPTFFNKVGEPYKVFTPFWKAAAANIEIAPPLPTPVAIPAPKHWPKSDALASFALAPTIPWAEGLRATWQPGETGALAELARMNAGTLCGYKDARDIPGVRGTSRLSPHLHFGEVSPRTVVAQMRTTAETGGVAGAIIGAEALVRQVYWREFAHYLLYHFPHTSEAPLRPEFAHFPWADDAQGLRAWQRGRTGYPIVDAGMRELWSTGWMHNRVRMIVASFLVKDLLIPWQAGARWFWDTLVDADLANNTMGWQWTAGCGADAAPYYRVFNPMLQSAKFDPNGVYLRHWVPELAALPNEYLHAPWEAPPLELNAAGLVLGKTYPERIVDHHKARIRALAALERIKR